MMNLPPRPSLLLIDNFDSFTYNLWDYFLRLGTSCEVVRNDRIDFSRLEKGEFDGLVLSPGPQRPQDAGQLMACVEAFYSSIPMLGVCLGHQAIGSFFGASLVKAPVPVHGKTSMIRHNDHRLFAGLPERFSVMRYHSLLLENLPEELECIARTDAGEVMALCHRELPLTGIQFHPESILTENGLDLLQNWLNSFMVVHAPHGK